MYIKLSKSNYQRGDGDPINLHIFVPVSRHVLSPFFFVLFIDFRREVVVSFVDIGGNNDLQCTISVCQFI
jgi:hypothetical protein